MTGANVLEENSVAQRPRTLVVAQERPVVEVAMVCRAVILVVVVRATWNGATLGEASVGQVDPLATTVHVCLLTDGLVGTRVARALHSEALEVTVDKVDPTAVLRAVLLKVLLAFLASI